MHVKATWNHNYTNDCIPNFSKNLILPRHRWYEFKEGFSKTLVERALFENRNRTDRMVVLDPFSGSGTTTLTALQNGHDAIAIEVNPFMNFVGKTKSTPKSNILSSFQTELNWIRSQKIVETDSPLEEMSSFSYTEGKEKWLFNPSVLRGFESIKQKVKNLQNHELFELALMNSIMQCCNAKKDGKCLRYKKNWQSNPYSIEHLQYAFLQNSEIMLNDINLDPLENNKSKFFAGDARVILPTISDETVDLIVFSPPYLNSFDYTDIYRPELFLGDYVSSNKELYDVRLKTLRSHVQCKWESKDKSESIWVENIFEQLVNNSDKLWNKNIPDMVTSYFYDMEAVFTNLYRISKPKTQLWFIVATSAYAGIEIPVDLILADIASNTGWNLINVNALRKLRTSSQSDDEIRKIRLRESLVICQK